MPLMLILAIALAILTALFVIQNAAVITVSFLIWEFEASLALVLILTLGVGVLIGYLATLPASWRKSSELRQTRRRQSELETMVRKDGGPETRPNAPNPGTEDDSGIEKTSGRGIG